MKKTSETSGQSDPAVAVLCGLIDADEKPHQELRNQRIDYQKVERA